MAKLLQQILKITTFKKLKKVFAENDRNDFKCILYM